MQTATPPQPPPCPVCLQSGGRAVDRLERPALIEAWASLDVQLSAQALAVLKDLAAIELFSCPSCGMRYFDPALAGTEQFYAELQQQLPNYYPESCPAFDRAVRFAQSKQLKSVLDVGCGCGAFLDQVKAAGLQTTGLEYNPKAAQTTSQKGHRVSTCSMADYPGKQEAFDLVTAFEVLEHVAAPRPFVEDAARLVRPGGYLAISVPSAHGFNGVWDLNPHQWPPHHLTRWRKQDLGRIGSECGLIPERLGGDLLLGGQWQYFAQLQNRLIGSVQSTQRVARRGFAPRPLVFLYRKLGLKHLAPRWGSSLYAFYRKP